MQRLTRSRFGPQVLEVDETPLDGIKVSLWLLDPWTISNPLVVDPVRRDGSDRELSTATRCRLGASEPAPLKDPCPDAVMVREPNLNEPVSSYRPENPGSLTIARKAVTGSGSPDVASDAPVVHDPAPRAKARNGMTSARAPRARPRCVTRATSSWIFRVRHLRT
jgi:hypothetical protein